MSGSSQAALRRRKALADAVSGVTGSLISLWTFYPIEVWKTNSQAGSAHEKKSIYQGILVKSMHTASSSFTYFYVYSWIFTSWKRMNPNATISTATRLLLSALAAMINTMFTLPLDVISSKQVTEKAEKQTDDTTEMTEEMDSLWEEMKSEPSNGESAEVTLDQPTYRPKAKKTEPEEEENWTGLWKGLAPSLLLCSNPSINYTVFDVSKAHLLNKEGRVSPTLNMAEAFVVGLFAKSIATIATYPLIRAKILLMVTSEKSMIGSIIRAYKEDGVRGLYKGCDWQLFHTVLKSALMMMIREKIAVSTSRFIIGDAK